MGAEPDIQQATINLFTDMGVFVGVQELSEGLVFPEMTRDYSAPTVKINSVDSPEEHSLKLVGEAKDVGGRVAAVEFSVDEGLSWHPVEEMRPVYKFTLDPSQKEVESWAWKINLSANTDPDGLGVALVGDGGKVDVTVRAVDDSYNIGKETSLRTSWK